MAGKTFDELLQEAVVGLQDTVREFNEDSDRAAVIVGAAVLDNLLSDSLERFLLPVNGKRGETLLGVDGPLGAFSARIDACYRLGLIDEQLCRSLHFIRKIRNDFAHKLGEKHQTLEAHGQRIDELCGSLENTSAFHEVQAIYESNTKYSLESRRFRAALIMIAGALHSMAVTTRRIEPPHATTSVPS